jgi:hypothetical protein
MSPGNLYPRLSILLSVLLLLVGAWGCTTTSTSIPEGAQASATPFPSSPTLSPTDTAIPPTTPPTDTPAASPAQDTPLPAAEPTPACITLFYEDFAQVELISSNGTRVLIDVQDPTRLSRPAEAADILLTTHGHYDHVNQPFLDAFPGQQLYMQTGELELPGVQVLGIASAHNAGDALKPEGGTNYIYLVEMDGMRIAHFGDIGQLELTDEQLALLGKVDIAITQLANSYSDMNDQNRKGFDLVEQIQPRLIIPTHINLDTAKTAVERWTGLYSLNPSVTICPADLPAGTAILMLGESAAQFKDRLDLSVVDW